MTGMQAARPGPDVTTLDRTGLVSLGRLRVFKAGEVVVDQRPDLADAALLLGGVVKVSGPVHGIGTMLGVRTGGDLVGEELALLGPGQDQDGIGYRRATGLTSGRAILIGVNQLRQHLGEHPADLLAVTRNLCRRHAETDELPASAASSDVRTRLSRALLQLHDLHVDPKRRGRGAELRVRLTQTEIASWIGASRESAVKALGELERRGTISRRRGRIAIQDPDDLILLGYAPGLPVPRPRM